MSISRMSRIGGEVTVVGGLPSFVFLTLPYYLRARLQWLRHSPSCRVLGAFLNAVESRHPLCRDAVDWRGEDGQYQDIATSHLFFLCLPLPAGPMAGHGAHAVPKYRNPYTRLPMAGIDFGQCRASRRPRLSRNWTPVLSCATNLLAGRFDVELDHVERFWMAKQ